MKINRQKDWVEVEGVFKLFLYENSFGYEITHVKKISGKKYNITIEIEQLHLLK